ncbi:MAG: hypothetical protein ABIJ61_13965 [bacterium]
MPRLAAIDIGSNSALLLIAESLPAGAWRVLLDTRRTVRMTQTPQAPGRIAEAAIAALEAVLAEYSELIEKLDAGDHVVGGATQALRAAENGREIAAQLQQRFGWPIRILAAGEEARLSYLAAASGIGQIPAERLVIDVGGGSTELVLGCDQRIVKSTSIPIGAVSLSAELRLSDAIAEPELSRVAAQTAAALESEIADFGTPPMTTLLVGGTASTLAALFLGQRIFDPELVHGVELQTDWIGSQLRKLAQLDLDERRRLISFDPDRAEIIIGGILVLERLLATLKIKSAIVSNRGLRWGLLIDSAVAGNAD